MGWSINPSSLASIDQNGVLSYQEHTSDVTYEISYSDDEGCSVTKSVTIKKCAPPPADCPESGGTGLGGAIYMARDFISSEAETEHPIAFHTGDTTFIGTPTISCDGTIITNAQMGSIYAPPGYQWIDLTHIANDGPERTGATVTISAPTTNGTCTYTVSLKQKKSPDNTFKVSIEFSEAHVAGYGSYVRFLDAESLTGQTIFNIDRYNQPIIFETSVSLNATVVALAASQNYDNSATIEVWWDAPESPSYLYLTYGTLLPSTSTEEQLIKFIDGRTFDTNEYCRDGHMLHIRFGTDH